MLWAFNLVLLPSLQSDVYVQPYNVIEQISTALLHFALLSSVQLKAEVE